MSCWTEYVVADVADAETVANSTIPRDRWTGFEGFKGFGAPHHAALAQVLGCATAEPDFSKLMFGDAGMVAELPPDFLRAVRTVPDDRVPGVASQWGRGWPRCESRSRRMSLRACSVNCWSWRGGQRKQVNPSCSGRGSGEPPAGWPCLSVLTKAR